MGDISLNNEPAVAAKEEKTLCLPENTNDSGYSAINYNQGNSEGKTGLYLYDCYYLIKKKLFPQHVKAEAKVQMKLAGGICANMFVSFFIPMTILFAVGRKGKVALAATGLGFTICNLTGHVYAIGVTSVCETFFSQAYGAKQLKRYGIMLQRATILSFLAILPSCALWINIDRILLLLGQDKEVAVLAGQFTMLYIPGIFCYILYNLLLRYLACQNIVYPSVYSGIASFIVNGICCYVFIFPCDLGVRGGALAVDISYFTYCLVLLIIILWKKLYKETWYGWSYDCLCEWGPFISLSASSVVLSISEWVCFEVGMLALGIIGSLEQAVQTILYSVAGLIYYGPLSFSISAAVRVGHFIGSGEPERAKVAMTVSLKLGALVALCVSMFLFSLHDVIPYVFTSDRSVIEMASNLVYIVAIVGTIDCFEVILAGVVRGLGYQRFGAIINFFAFLCMGTLSYLLLIFKAHLRVLGYWLGISIAIVLQTIAMFTLVYKIDWKKLSALVREKVGVVDESTPNDVCLKVADDGKEGDSLKLEPHNSIECPGNDIQREDAFLIVETSLSQCENDDASRNEDHKESTEATVNAFVRADKDIDCDVFFVYRPPQFKKRDVIIKITVISLLFLGVTVSAVGRFYF